MRIAAAVVFAAWIMGCGRPSPNVPPPNDPNAPERNSTLLLEHGRGYAQLGDHLRAQQYFAASIKAGADEKVAVPLLLRACVAQKNYRLAIEYAEQSLARHPKNARLRFLTGALHGMLGENAKARVNLVRAAKELPKDAEVQFSVGVFFRDEAGDIVASDGYFRKYLELDPEGEHVEEAKASLMEKIETPAATSAAASTPAESAQ